MIAGRKLPWLIVSYAVGYLIWVLWMIGEVLPLLRVRLEIHGWVVRRSRLPPMATRIMAWETSMRAS